MFNIVNPLVVDFETFFNTKTFCSIRPNMKNGNDWVGGNWHYTHHREFYPYIVSWCDPVTGETGISDKRDEFPSIVNSWKGRTLVGHNIGFDIAVAKTIVPGFEPINSVDTSDMAQYFQAPRSLDVAVLHLLGLVISKEARNSMDGVHYSELDAERRKAMLDYAKNDPIVTAQLYNAYIGKWPWLEQWISNHNRIQNEEGVNIDTNYLEDQVDKVLHIRCKALENIPWAESDRDKPLSAKKLAIYCREIGIEPPASLAEDSEECQAWEAKYGADYPVVAAIRDFRKSNTYYKKLKLIQLLLRPDNTIPLETMYAAAPHTLRFSARKFNYQSLPREHDFCDLRGCIVPPAGHSFIGSDLAGLEARCLPWLAGDMDYLAQVAKLDSEAVDGETGDLYEPQARRLFGYSDPRPLKKVDKELRFATKTCVLQLGYQSGSSKFLWYLNNNVPKSVLDRVRINDEPDDMLAARLVKLYRGTNPRIVGLWYGVDGDLRAACMAGEPFKVQLPNGRVVEYTDLGLRETNNGGKYRVEVVGKNCKGTEPVKLYGGKLTENICQGMARDVLVQSIYNLTQAGYKVRFSVHDENVVQVPEDKANRDTRREIEQIMSRTPEWAAGLPLAAETTIMKRYAK